MRVLIAAFAALISLPALASERLCPGQSFHAADTLTQAQFEREFELKAAMLRTSREADFAGGFCAEIMQGFDRMVDAGRAYRVQFIQERPWLCDGQGGRRQVDAVNRPGDETKRIAPLIQIY